MQGSNNTVGESHSGKVSYSSEESDNLNKDEVVETKGRSNNRNVIEVETDLHVDSYSKDGLDSETSNIKTISSRIGDLRKIDEFDQGIGGELGKNKYFQKAVTPKTSDSKSVDDDMCPVSQLRRVVNKFDKVIVELGQNHNVTENSIIGNIDNEAAGKKELQESDVNDIGTLTDEISVNSPESKSAAQTIKRYSRVWICFQKIKRFFRSKMIHDVGNVKAKDFRAIPSNMLDVIKGTGFEDSMNKYNTLRNELVSTDKSSKESIEQRATLKNELLNQVKQMEKEFNEVLHGSESEINSACHQLKKKDRIMIIEQLRSRIGFNLSALQGAE